jgi:3-oxoacyl-[acyl-carrier protein] reductase
MPMRLNEKVAIVTGSASGIGKAIAQRFASEGAFAIIAFCRDGSNDSNRSQSCRSLPSIAMAARAPKLSFRDSRLA